MYLSVNEITVEPVYLGYAVIFAPAVICAFCIRYFTSIKILKEKPKLFFNLPSVLTDYTFIIFIAVFGIKSQFVMIPVLISLFDYIYILIITSVFLNLNKRFNTKLHDKI